MLTSSSCTLNSRSEAAPPPPPLTLAQWSLTRGLVLLGVGAPRGRALTRLATHSLGRVLAIAFLSCSSLCSNPLPSRSGHPAFNVSMSEDGAAQVAAVQLSTCNVSFPLIGTTATSSLGRCPAPTAIAAGLGAGTLQSQPLLGRFEMSEGGGVPGHAGQSAGCPSVFGESVCM